MTGNERRKKIIDILSGSDKPVSGRALAQMLKVSRQVIVQDMALLRAGDKNIVSTNLGYIIEKPDLVSRVFKVKHTDEQVQEELSLIIDYGGAVEDVFVYHKVYGEIRAPLEIRSRADIAEFIDRLKTGKSGLLKNVTSDYHYHTVTAPSEKLLDIIQRELQAKGFLAKLMDFEPVDFWEGEAKKDGILGVGVATMDIYVNRGRMYPGGNEFNVVCNARFLGSRAGFLGVFGDDIYGPMLEATLKEKGVDVSMCRHEHGTSGFSHVELKEDGDRHFIDWNQQGVNDLYPIAFTPEEMEYVKTFRVVELSRYSTVSLEKMEFLHSQGVDICYDFSDESDDIEQIAPYCKYAFFSCSHLTMDEIHKILEKTVSLGCSLAVATRGVDSVIAYDGTSWYEQATFPVVKVVDALGAGDSYIGAFLTNYFKCGDLQQSLENAARHSSYVVTIEGSIGVVFETR